MDLRLFDTNELGTREHALHNDRQYLTDPEANIKDIRLHSALQVLQDEREDIRVVFTTYQ